MFRRLTMAALTALALAPAIPSAAAQEPEMARLTGTRLDITASGEVSRIPDIVRIAAGVHTQAPTAAEAMRQNQARMERVRAALIQAGIADRDTQTSSFQLEAVYRNIIGGRQELAGYRTSNQLFIRLRDPSSSGRVMDALVAEGVNDIQGPILGYENVETSLDEARALAIAAARARAALYARGLGMRVRRAVYVSEEGGSYTPRNYGRRNDGDNLSNSLVPAGTVTSTIDPGGRKITATVSVVFELE
jgi:uncharacterized protein YggE